MATSTGSASPFSGSGIIATLTFRVTNPGSTGLALTSELSDHPAAGGNSNLIDHTDTSDSVTVVASGPSASPQPSTSIPEFSNIALITILIIVISATVATISTKRSKSKSILSTQKATNL